MTGGLDRDSSFTGELIYASTSSNLADERARGMLKIKKQKVKVLVGMPWYRKIFIV